MRITPLLLAIALTALAALTACKPQAAAAPDAGREVRQTHPAALAAAVDEMPAGVSR